MAEVITWTKQVRYVLKQARSSIVSMISCRKRLSLQEPEHVFREGSPQPDAELQFWRSRANNLNSIHMQLQMEGVKRARTPDAGPFLALSFLTLYIYIYIFSLTHGSGASLLGGQQEHLRGTLCKASKGSRGLFIWHAKARSS